MIKHILIGSLALILFTGCAHVPKRTFPLGVYSVGAASDLAEVKEAGFSHVVGPATQVYLDKAHQEALQVLAAPPASTPQLRKLDRHAALWAWYLIDEPDLHLVPPTEVQGMHRTLRERGARKPTALTLFQGYEAEHYGRIADVLMVDRYPVPWLPLANFGQHIKMARLAVGDKKPLIAIVQAFDWSAYPDLLPGRENLRPPTSAELRCMVYEALARGADGIFFYEFDRRWKIREHPELWTALKATVREVRQREPLFVAESRWWPREHRFKDPETAFNAALESSVTSRLLAVQSGNSEMPPGLYILCVNNTPRDLEYSFRIPITTAAPPTLPVLGENRELAISQHRVKDQFSPYAVHIYGPLHP